MITDQVDKTGKTEIVCIVCFYLLYDCYIYKLVKSHQAYMLIVDT